MSVIDQTLAFFSLPEADLPYDEAVTEREHALQTAALATQAGAPDHLVAAALLHDIGHLIVKDLQPIDATLERDAHHEVAGARYLADAFGPRVSQPVRWHVAAKRYLCASESGYAGALSPSSVRSLEVQGGAMSRAELVAFSRLDGHADAIAVRRWDDEAKVAGLDVPGLDSYRQLLTRVALPSG